ncbi:MAG: hypothetical protein ACTHML_05990 [Ginsengibacter sp.]|jgi:hypothetical protein
MKFYVKIAVVLFFISSSGCATISGFDQYAYTQATSIKVDALNVMNLATENYTNHLQEVSQVNNEIEKIYEYEKNRPKNSITTRMWQRMEDTSGHLYAGFIHRWKDQGKLSQAFVDDEKELVAKSFDQIAGLESKKIKPSSITN